MNQKELKDGKVFVFNNEQFQLSIPDDDVREAEVSWSSRFDFVIMFNGACVCCCKTFKTLKKKLDELSNRWHLEFARSDD